MIYIHKSADRGKSDLGWLKSRFSFSFADYHNPRMMGFGELRVLNDDEIAPGKGFGAHNHHDMEIITIVTAGELAHRDSTGSSGVIRPGDVQVMSAGTGVVHSEFNNSRSSTAKLFQIWINTRERGIKPRYGQMSFKDDFFKNRFGVVASGTKKPGELYIHQYAKVMIGNFEKEKTTKIIVPDGKGLYIFAIEGKVQIEHLILEDRDAAAVKDHKTVSLKAIDSSKVLAIEVPV